MGTPRVAHSVPGVPVYQICYARHYILPLPPPYLAQRRKFSSPSYGNPLCTVVAHSTGNKFGDVCLGWDEAGDGEPVAAATCNAGTTVEMRF